MIRYKKIINICSLIGSLLFSCCNHRNLNYDLNLRNKPTPREYYSSQILEETPKEIDDFYKRHFSSIEIPDNFYTPMPIKKIPDDFYTPMPINPDLHYKKNVIKPIPHHSNITTFTQQRE